ncbi:MAG: DUF6473 family protein [Phormidesmis sp.]
MLNVGYQKRDFDFFDYDLYTIMSPDTKKRFVLRGPSPLSLEEGTYFTSLGPAFTYGCYTDKPYTQMLAEELNFSALNLGVQGAGPSHYTNSENELLLELINRSKFAIIAVMSGRSVSNSLFEVSEESQEKLRISGDKHFQPAHKAYEWLLANHDSAYVEKIITETRNNFVQEYINLLTKVKVPKILLWFSKREPAYKENYCGEVWELLGKFPHLVNRDMINSIKEYSDDYVECITKTGTPQALFDRFSGQLGVVRKDPAYGYSSSNYNMYYASPEMHLSAVNKLAKPCSRYLAKGSCSSLIQPRDLIGNLKELHFQEFLLSTGHTDSLVLSEIEIKNYLFENYEKVFNNLILMEDRVYLPEEKGEILNFIDLRINNKNKSLDNIRDLEKCSKCFDLVYDVLPFIISKPKKVSIEHLIETETQGSNPTNLFAVVCTPRSGSSFLCDLLKLNGAGAPIEHLRPPLLYILENRQRLNIDLELLLRRILYRCSKDKLFGTKVISHFFFDLMTMLEPDEIEKLMTFFRHFKVIYLYRRNKTAQAVSKFLASKSKFWHSTAPNRSFAEYKEQVQSIDYEFEAIKSIYDGLVNEERNLEKFLDESKFNQVLKVEYEQFKETPLQEMEKIVDFLNIDVSDFSIESDYEVLSSAHSTDLIAKFNLDYQKALEENSFRT